MSEHETIFDSNERFEVIAHCFRIRFGQMAPGKDSPAAMAPAIDDLSHEDNFKRWAEYIKSDKLENDLIGYILRLEHKLEE